MISRSEMRRIANQNPYLLIEEIERLRAEVLRLSDKLLDVTAELVLLKHADALSTLNDGGHEL